MLLFLNCIQPIDHMYTIWFLYMYSQKTYSTSECEIKNVVAIEKV